jgi:hypothetical protein
VVGGESGKIGEEVFTEFKGFPERELMEVLNAGDSDDQGIVVCSWPASPEAGNAALVGQELPGKLIDPFGFNSRSSHSNYIISRWWVFEQPYTPQRLKCLHFLQNPILACFKLKN